MTPHPDIDAIAREAAGQIGADVPLIAVWTPIITAAIRKAVTVPVETREATPVDVIAREAAEKCGNCSGYYEPIIAAAIRRAVEPLQTELLRKNDLWKMALTDRFKELSVSSIKNAVLEAKLSAMLVEPPEQFVALVERFNRTACAERDELKRRCRELEGTLTHLNELSNIRNDALIQILTATREKLSTLERENAELNKALALKFDAMPSGLSAGQSIALEARLTAAREVLKAVEWESMVGLTITCPSCHWPETNGHAPGCKLAEALK